MATTNENGLNSRNMETTVGEGWGSGVGENDPRGWRTDGGHSAVTTDSGNQPSTGAPIESPDENTGHTGDHAVVSPPTLESPDPVVSPDGPVSEVVKKSDFYIYRLVKKFGKTFLKNEPTGVQTKISEGMDIAVEGGKIVGKKKVVVEKPDTCEGHTVPLNTIEVEYVSPFIALVRVNKETMKNGNPLIANYPQENGSQVTLEKSAEDKFGNYMYTVNRYFTAAFGIIERKSNRELREVYVQNGSQKLYTKQVEFPAGGVITEYEAGSHTASIATRCINDSSKLVMMSAWDFDDNELQFKSGSTTIGEYLIVMYATEKGKEMMKSNPNLFGPTQTPDKHSAGSNIIPIVNFAKHPSKDVKDNFKWLAVKINRKWYGGAPGQSLTYYEFDTENLPGVNHSFQLTTASFSGGGNGFDQSKKIELLNTSLNVSIPKTHPDAQNMTIFEDYMWTLPVSDNGLATQPDPYVKTIGGGMMPPGLPRPGRPVRPQ